MEALDFTGVDAASEKSYTRPGRIGVFKVTGIVFDKSKVKQTPYMGVTFEDAESTFTHPFYLSAKAISRIQSMITAIYGEGAKLTGKITNEQLKAKLMGKELALKVIGEVSSNGKGFASLSFGGFCKSKEEATFLRFSEEDQKKVDAALAAIENSRQDNADTETYSSTDSTGTGEYVPVDATGTDEAF